MKPILRIATHALALILGVALASTVLPMISSSRDGQNSPSGLKAGGEVSATGKMKTKAGSGPRGESRPAAYRAAWAALAKEPLGMAARLQAQRQLLAEWAKIDLSGAIHAYLGEAWDTHESNNPFSNPLGDAFAAAFADQPLESWKALGRDPMARQLLGGIWVSNVVQKEPGLVVAMLGEIPANLHFNALAQIFSGGAQKLTEDPRKELLSKLASSGTPEQVETWMSAVYRITPLTSDPSDHSAKWSAMPAGGQRTREMAAWASSMRATDTTKFAEEWAKVPTDDRGQAARMLLAQVDNKSPALTDTIEHAVEAGQWQALSAGVADKLRGFDTDRQALAEWALKLPAREEVRAIYNLSISEKLLADPVAGREWLEQLPPGDWHRESGFIEMMLGSLWVRGDIGAANRAIESITDPRTREEAIKARYDWQLMTRQPDVIRAK